ncbi:MAG: beta-galactosidase [Candidatus Promineifilaceae bacterium]
MKIFQPSRLLHGADYNYEQWLDYPDILAEDFRLMREAHCNVMSVGIFAWSLLEPTEGEYQFAWLDQLMDRLAENEIQAMLATPSGGKPVWMAAAYPEIRLVNANGHREPHCLRHNHCPTSPIYRQKVRQINTLLAERYQNHPALLMWHVSNEYGAHDCRCELCLTAFQKWLQARYGSLDRLNHAWWTTFWSHRYTDWEQIRPDDPSVQGLMLAWRRFNSDQVVDFYRAEIEPLRAITPHIPITTNFMKPNVGLDYWEFARQVDVVSWDSYPRWHSQTDERAIAVMAAFYHDLHRSYKRQPFLLMESTPSVTNWQGISRPKRPRMHLLSSLQAIAHGSNSVQYFQWRQSRGGEEKFHGAVIGHVGQAQTRIFQEVTEVGGYLAQLNNLWDTCNQAEVALLYDLQNEWALNLAQLPRNEEKQYQEQCLAHYAPFWQQGITVDLVASSTTDFSPYKLIIAPMLYLLREGVAERLTEFVQGGGTLITTYLSGIVDENDLCFVGESPLRSLLGLWVEETDVLFAHDRQVLNFVPGHHWGLEGNYPVTHFADVIHLDSAQPLACYGHDFYAGQPALTVNEVGRGRAYYLAARTDSTFLQAFYTCLSQDLGLARAIPTPLPEGVTAQVRVRGREQFLFLLNFNATPQPITLPSAQYQDALSAETVCGVLTLDGYGMRVLRNSTSP